MSETWKSPSVIVALRELEFSLDDIREILADCRDDADILAHLERQKDVARARSFATIKTSSRQIDELIEHERTRARRKK